MSEDRSSFQRHFDGKRRVLLSCVAFIALAVVSAACSDDVIYDDFGTSGYARFSGTVTRADGSAYRDAPLYASCGRESTDGFGQTFNARSDGTFDIEMASPGVHSLPADRRLVCRISIVRASAGSAVATRVVFAATAPARSTTMFAIREGVVVDSTGP